MIGVEYFVYKENSRSDVGYFAVVYFDHFLLKLLNSSLLEIKIAFVVLRHPVRVAEHEAALAFVSQQSHLLLAREATLPIHLQLSLRLLLFLLGDIRLHFLGFLLHFRELLELLGGLRELNFHLGLFLPFSGLGRGVLKAGGAEPVGVLGAVEGLALIAEHGLRWVSS